VNEPGVHPGVIAILDVSHYAPGQHTARLRVRTPDGIARLGAVLPWSRLATPGKTR
jgi:hypothetical protein